MEEEDEFEDEEVRSADEIGQLQFCRTYVSVEACMLSHCAFRAHRKTTDTLDPLYAAVLARSQSVGYGRSIR